MPTVHTYATHNTSYNNNWCNWCNNFHIILSVMVHLIPFLSLLCLLFSVYCSGCQLCFIGHSQHPGGYFSFYLRLYTHTLRQTVVILCIWACVQALSYQQLSDCCFHIHATDTQKLLSWEDNNAEDCKTTDRCLASHAVALDRRDWNKRHKFKSKRQKTKAMTRTAN